jgi:hypothetical protein
MNDKVKTPWEFACDWYQPDEIHRTLNRRRDPLTGNISEQIPEDVTSREFAEWLTDQYRLAMNKGIQIGREWPVFDSLKETEQ